MNASTLSIGEVAEAAGVATSTLRYYDRLGLVVDECPTITNTEIGRRLADSRVGQ